MAEAVWKVFGFLGNEGCLVDGAIIILVYFGLRVLGFGREMERGAGMEEMEEGRFF